jgi:hypothetical protein
MQAESARATTAAEARFRIAAPNARPRQVAVLPLDTAAQALVAVVARQGWRHARFLALDDGADWLHNLGAHTRALMAAVADAHLVVLVASAGADAGAAALVAEATAARGVTTAAILLDSGEAEAPVLERSLAALRPHAAMLVVATDADYVVAMLQALRA